MATKKPVADINQLKPTDFRYSTTPGYEGNIYAGWKLVRDTKEHKGEEHACYQFRTFDEIIAAARGILLTTGVRRLRVVTHSGQYKNMKTLFEWKDEVK